MLSMFGKLRPQGVIMMLVAIALMWVPFPAQTVYLKTAFVTFLFVGGFLLAMIGKFTP